MGLQFKKKSLVIVWALSMSAVAQITAQNSCEAMGWASQSGGTTGGGRAAATQVTTYSELKAAVLSASVKRLLIVQRLNQPHICSVNNWFCPQGVR